MRVINHGGTEVKLIRRDSLLECDRGGMACSISANAGSPNRVGFSQRFWGRFSSKNFRVVGGSNHQGL
jgi:hypothetical protein